MQDCVKIEELKTGIKYCVSFNTWSCIELFQSFKGNGELTFKAQSCSNNETWKNHNYIIKKCYRTGKPQYNLISE